MKARKGVPFYKTLRIARIAQMVIQEWNLAQ